MRSLPASAEPRAEWPATPATPVVRAARRTVSSARLRPGRVLGGIALVVLCAILFYLVVLYLSAPGLDLWSVNAAIRKGLGGLQD